MQNQYDSHSVLKYNINILNTPHPHVLTQLTNCTTTTTYTYTVEATVTVARQSCVCAGCMRGALRRSQCAVQQEELSEAQCAVWWGRFQSSGRRTRCGQLACSAQTAEEEMQI